MSLLAHEILTTNLSRALALVLQGRLSFRMPSVLHEFPTENGSCIFGVEVKSTGSADRLTVFKSLSSLKYIYAEL